MARKTRCDKGKKRGPYKKRSEGSKDCEENLKKDTEKKRRRKDATMGVRG